MSDLISRQAAISEANRDGAYGYISAEELGKLPSAEPMMKGRWEEKEEDMDGMTLQIKRCSKCGASKPMKIFRLENYEFNFCHNCGARMSEGEDNE